MDWGGDASLAGNKRLAGEAVHRHHRRVAEKTAELHCIADLLADYRDDTDSDNFKVGQNPKKSLIIGLYSPIFKVSTIAVPFLK